MTRAIAVVRSGNARFGTDRAPTRHGAAGHAPSGRKGHLPLSPLRKLGGLLAGGLLAVGMLAVAPAARASTCPDPANTDCPSPPSAGQFVQLVNDTLTLLGPGPISAELVEKVQGAQDALHPPAPIHPPSPIRGYYLLGGYLNQVQALAGTTQGATGAGASLLADEASALRSQISAAFPALQFPPRPDRSGR